MGILYFEESNTLVPSHACRAPNFMIRDSTNATRCGTLAESWHVPNLFPTGTLMSTVWMFKATVNVERSIVLRKSPSEC